MTGYICELCGTDRGNYASMMACEFECHAESVAARKNHVSPRVMRPMHAWEDDLAPGGVMVSSRTGLTPHLRFRKAVLGRDRRAGVTNCPDCNCELDYEISRQPNSAEPDHIVPAEQAHKLGWTDAQLNAPSNGRTICRLCNQSRGSGKIRKKASKATITASSGW